MRKIKTSSFRALLDRLKGYLYFVISLFLIISLIRNIAGIRRSAEKIDTARERVEDLEEKKTELQAQLDQAQSDLYVEKQLRDGLGLAQESEVVIVLPEETVLRRVAPEIDDSPSVETEKPIWRKWIELFVMIKD